MVCKIMCGKPFNRKRSGWTLVEMMVALAIFGIAGAAIASFYVFGSRSFAALSNYAILDKSNREALDLLTREIRQAKHVLNYSTNPPTLSLISGEGHTIVYTFNPSSQQMVRDSSDGSHKVLLNNCQLLNFNLYKRNPSNANYGIFPTATDDWKNTAKVLVLTWKTSMTISPTARVTSENVQTARIVIRKAQTYD
jgi:prepilin-type N-terminal cleavage/methylation domain-containing protein